MITKQKEIKLKNLTLPPEKHEQNEKARGKRKKSCISHTRL